MTINEALKAIQNKDYNPVYLLSGKEKFFHDQVINSFSKVLFSDTSSRSLNRIILYGSENSLSEIVNACLSYPMMSDYKMVVVREFARIKTTDADVFTKYLENPQKSNILILSAEDTGKSAFFKKISEKAVNVDCRPVPDYKIAGWLKEYIQQKNINMTTQAVNMLAEYTGSNLLNIEHELNKVIEYKKDNSEITADEIIAVTGMSKEYNVFTLQKALAEKNIKKSFLISKNLIDAGENINLIVSILYSFFKKVYMVAKLRASGTAQAQIAQQLRISDFQFRDISATTNKYNINALEKCVKILQNSDRTIKNSAQDDRVTIQDLCYNICRQ